MTKSRLLTILLILNTTQAVGDDTCDMFEDLSHGVMTARQKGYKIDYTANNQMEHEMMLNAWQWPQYHGIMMQQRTIKLFSGDWAYACKQGYYNTQGK